MREIFLAIDFDGTISEADVTDAVLTRYASGEWLAVEALWVSGAIGSRECLARQIALVDADLATVLSFVEEIKIDRHYGEFVQFLGERGLPAAIISDGFAPFIRRILGKAGVDKLPVFANLLSETNGRLEAGFADREGECRAGTCKCSLAGSLGQGRPVVLVGDGRSDFCLADKASFVFARGKLAAYCHERGIIHAVFDDFRDVVKGLRMLDKASLRGYKAS